MKFFIFLFAIVIALLITIEINSFDFVSEIEQIQINSQLSTGYPQQLKRGDFGLSPNIEVWVYETPTKDWGYQIIEYGENFINSKGYGQEAEDRTFLKVSPKDIDGNLIDIPYEKPI